jgi:signal transduction histidine kinase/ligand-binding sensor domain-containing protein
VNRLLLITLLLLIHGITEAQDRVIPGKYELPGERQIKRFTSDDGLPANTIFNITRDDLGYYWLMTSGGVSRFDGYTFTTIDVPSDPVTGAKETYLYKAQQVPGYGFFAWSSSFLYHLNEQSHQLEILQASTALTNSLDTSIFDFDGEFLIANSNGLFRAYGPQTTPEQLFNTIEPVFNFSFQYAAHQKNTIWVAHSDTLYRISRLDAKEAVASLPANIPHDRVLLNFSYDNQYLWVILTNGLQQSWLSRFNPADGSFTRFQELEIGINGVSEDRSGRLWMTTHNDGLYVRHADGTVEAFTLLPDKLIFPPQIIDNVLWLNTNASGLIIIDLNSPKFGLIPIRQSFGDVTIGHLTKNIYVNSETLWLLNHEPPYTLFEINRNSGHGRKHIFPLGRQTINISDFATLDGRIFWIAGYNAPVIRYDAQTGERTFLPHWSESESTIESHGILALTPHEVWIANRNQIGRYDIETGTFTSFAFPDATTREIRYWQFDGFIDTSGEYLWFPVHNEIGRFHIPSETFHFIQIPQTGGSQVKMLAFHQGRLAAAIENGFALIDTLSGRIDYFDTRQGLPDNFIYGFLEDNSGHLWLSSNRGLTRAMFDVTPDTVTATFQNFGYSDGIQSNEFNTYAMFKEDDGTLWFGGIGGLNWFDPDRNSDPRPDIPIHFTMLRTSDSQISESVSLLRSPQVQLAYNQRTYTIDFVAIDPLSANDLHYAYMLEGFDREWINSGSQRSARFTNIPPGDYRLGVKVSRNNENWGEPVWLPLSIARPFWQKSWFLITISLVLVGFVFGIARYLSDRKFRAQVMEFEKRDLINQERARIARDLHDEIGANLSQIALLSDIILQKNDHDTTHDPTMVRRVARVARENITNLSEIVWSLNPQNDNLEEFASYVQEYTENFFEPSGIRTMFEIDESFPDVTIDSNKRHHLLMSIKEILNNCMKHAHPTTVNLKITYNPGKLQICIRDDGAGFDLKNQNAVGKRGNGLQNLFNRIQQFGGTIRMESKPGGGCQVDILLPV